MQQAYAKLQQLATQLLYGPYEPVGTARAESADLAI